MKNEDDSLKQKNCESNGSAEHEAVEPIISDRNFIHGEEEPCTNQFLKDPILNLLKSVGTKRVLDIGCGNGTLDKYLIEGGIEIVGVEPGDDGIKNARKLLPGTIFFQLGVYDDPLRITEDGFDAVLSTEVIEHLYQPRKLIEFAKAKLKPGGYLLLTTPYHGYIKNMMLSVFNKWDYHHAPWWDGGHIKFWSKASLTALVEEQDFKVVKFVGIGRAPYLWRHMALLCQLQTKDATYAG